MIAGLDVHYLEAPASPAARAAVVTFASFSDAAPLVRSVIDVAHVEPYEPGSFYRRELPCVLAVLATLAELPEIVIVDGHAWLAEGVPGLGARLLEAEPRIRTVIGVAKTRYREAPAAEVLRGGSQSPLWVDEAGVAIDAARMVSEMHGPHRVPTMLRLVDQLCRGLASPRARRCPRISDRTCRSPSPAT